MNISTNSINEFKLKRIIKRVINAEEEYMKIRKDKHKLIENIKKTIIEEVNKNY